MILLTSSSWSSGQSPCVYIVRNNHLHRHVYKLNSDKLKFSTHLNVEPTHETRIKSIHLRTSAHFLWFYAVLGDFKRNCDFLDPDHPISPVTNRSCK